jgi:hypothetical protein
VDSECVLCPFVLPSSSSELPISPQNEEADGLMLSFLSAICRALTRLEELLTIPSALRRPSLPFLPLPPSHSPPLKHASRRFECFSQLRRIYRRAPDGGLRDEPAEGRMAEQGKSVRFPSFRLSLSLQLPPSPIFFASIISSNMLTRPLFLQRRFFRRRIPRRR